MISNSSIIRIDLQWWQCVWGRHKVGSVGFMLYSDLEMLVSFWG